ncbi:2-phospho-L-lactate guanylyltransferase [Amycolatopsis acidicola]|uniref:2-phospho-L-lactate guanylyltransferase n=1 Tax=Amycolatopsis acidicola TaxID=2596893 RepID=A0A5N0UQ48_9PSEU|nr:2-phospho-L-lactate guanylyltransferase [Amycolatopsis acidicola]KAA9153008.1 2-phospho-L-lactate guanylyltransferase [Amycolatopsis acidicola]
MKPPRAGKSRLRGAVADAAHPGLVLALAEDTLAAAGEVADRILIVASDVDAVMRLRRPGVEIVAEQGAHGLNAALRQGEKRLRADDPDAVIGALQADLPALRADELAAAIAEAAGRRAFVADWEGTGTTLLLSAPGEALEPKFGPGSARAHRETGARALELAAPSLRRDVDSPADLAHARRIGLGARTAELLVQGRVA